MTSLERVLSADVGRRSHAPGDNRFTDSRLSLLPLEAFSGVSSVATSRGSRRVVVGLRRLLGRMKNSRIEWRRTIARRSNEIRIRVTRDGRVGRFTGRKGRLLPYFYP